MPDRGMTGAEEWVYGLLIDHGPISVEQVIRERPVHDTGEIAEDVINALIERGLAIPTAQGHTLRAAPPALAMAPFMRRKHDELREAQAMVDDLVARYWARSPSPGIGYEFDIVEGAEQVTDRAVEFMVSAKESLWTMAMEIDLEHYPPTGYEAVLDLPARGVEHRLLLDASALSRPHLVEDLGRVTNSGVHLHLAAGVPSRMMLVDHRVGVLPLTNHEVSSSRLFVVYDSPALDCLYRLHELLWRASNPISMATGGVGVVSSPLAPEDNQILEFVLTGATDETIARQLGLSLRTMQRRVRHMMDLCGAHTRVQLGYEVGRRGWLAGAGNSAQPATPDPLSGPSTPPVET